MRGDLNGGWIILRTSGAKTLPLARSLEAAGIESWTPRYVETPKSGKPEREIAITPTFVFARSHQLPALSAILALPNPGFSFFRFAGRIPLIADSEIEGLRLTEERSRIRSRRSKRRALVMGQRVKFEQGAFAGLGGEIIRIRGKSALVAFQGGLQVEIDSWLLPEDAVNDEPSHFGNAA